MPNNTGFIPEAFALAVAQLRQTTLRHELDFCEIIAPQQLAPHSYAAGAAINNSGSGIRGAGAVLDNNVGCGRFALLYDPAQRDIWQGDFKVVCYAQSNIEVELGTDPLIADVAWQWLATALASEHAGHTEIAGTATVTTSTGYGRLASSGSGSQLQIRASWTPEPQHMGAHLSAWGQLICLLAGLDHEAGVASLAAYNKQKI
ncbi:DUF3000 family protein [Canibacter sp. lx-45]|uniref:DUF3000 family protein n=1 Tax=Canibacter zhuwentaonis TaxID=2837491 RepID=UPI001BDD0F96|nr:DUF3000 family protein [Canibacter zhuwentaonis]